MVLENKQQKEYLANIKKRYQEYQHRQQQEQYSRDREYFEQKPQKYIKKQCTRMKLILNLRQKRVSTFLKMDLLKKNKNQRSKNSKHVNEKIKYSIT